MGNCSFKGASTGVGPKFCIRLLTDSGDIVVLNTPRLAKDVVDEYPGYGIFKQGHASSPVSSEERLVNDQFYYLLPLEALAESEKGKSVKQGEERRVPLVEKLANGEGIRVLPSQKKGVWKVKLMINTKQLEEILAEEGNTEALIEKMRMAAAATATSNPKRTKASCLYYP
ncbi:uncharacterized protein LOC110819057 [Carica papaya]|uniref:uncharacterized protein LOC110819057 n=1 Tax=Carica papaya TaxID=3649 RepID=UPI000B8D18E7|nr:uncharacterized protein LOC110819057 [Carica papaya]